ncbi:MAG: hypothetical protein ACLR76_05565 [Alistipes sp.]
MQSENIADNGMADRIRPLLGDRRAIEGKRYDFYWPTSTGTSCSPTWMPMQPRCLQAACCSEAVSSKRTSTP